MTVSHQGLLQREIIRCNAQWYGARLAYVDGSRRFTFKEFDDQCAAVAAALASLGLKCQDRVGLLGMNSFEYSLGYGACEYGGFVAATVNFRLATPEMGRILEDAAPTALIFESHYADAVASLKPSLPTIKHFICIGETPQWATSFDDLVTRGRELPLVGGPTAEDLAYLIYTSGTTGRPKGVMITHRAADAAARLIGATFQAGPEDKVLIVMPSFHVGAKNVENATRRAGGCVVLRDRFDPSAIPELIEKEGITVTLLAPSMIQALLEEPGNKQYDLSSLRAVIYSAAAMPTSLLRKALDRFGPVFIQQYGQTEGMGTVLPAHAHLPDGNDSDLERLGSVGHPFPECSVRVVDDADRQLPIGEPGELCLRGPFIMTGYWNNSVETLSALRGGWLHTGDIARIDQDGYVYLVDRKKDVIISGGENIYSREVENALLAHPDVTDAAVVGRPDPKWGEAVCAFVEIAKDASISGTELIAHCRSLIGGYKVPKHIFQIAQLPRLATGKVSKVALRDKLKQEFTAEERDDN